MRSRLIVAASMSIGLLASGCVTLDEQASVTASCQHVTSERSVAICTSGTEVPVSEVLVACREIGSPYRKLYRQCDAGDGPSTMAAQASAAHLAVSEPEDDDFQGQVQSSGTRVGITRDDGYLDMYACAGSTCSTFTRSGGNEP